MVECEESSYINICRYKFLRRKLQYFYAEGSIFYDYFRENVIDHGNKTGLIYLTKHFMLIEIFIRRSFIDENFPKLIKSDENIKELLYFQNILILEFILNELENNNFEKEAIKNNSFSEIFYVFEYSKSIHKFTRDCYYEIYRYLLQLVSCYHLELKEKNEEFFYKYDEYLNNSFERTNDIFIRKEFKLEKFMDILYEKLSISFDEIIEECKDKLANIENAFINYFTHTKLDENIDKDTNINLQMKINTFKKHTHFFSFFEELDIDTIKLNKEEKIVFPLFVISLRNALIRSCLIESIKNKNDLKKAKRVLEKFIKNKKESLKDRIEAYIFLTILSNGDIRFKNLDIVFLCHYLSLSCSQTERFIKTKIYLKKSSTSIKELNIKDIRIDEKAVRKFYYLLDKTYFENPNIEDFLALYAKKIDPKQFKFNLREDLKKLLENKSK